MAGTSPAMTMWKQPALNLIGLSPNPEPPDDLGAHGTGLVARADAGAAKPSSGLQADRKSVV